MITKHFYAIQHIHSDHLMPNWVHLDGVGDMQEWSPSPLREDTSAPELFTSEQEAEWFLVKFLSKYSNNRLSHYRIIPVTLSATTTVS